MAGYEPVRSRLRWALAALAFTILLDAIAVASDLSELRLLERIERGERVTDATIDRNDTRQAAIGVLQLVVFAATVFFVRWFHRLYKNLAALGADGLRWCSGWAICSWFIPSRTCGGRGSSPTTPGAPAIPAPVADGFLVARTSDARLAAALVARLAGRWMGIPA